MTQQYTFQPFDWSDEQYEAITEIHNAIYYDQPLTVTLMKHFDKNKVGKPFNRLVCEVNGRIAAVGAYGQSWWSEKPGKYFINLEVHPDFQNQGIGAQFYSHMEPNILNADDLRVIQGDTREDFEQGIRFLENRGYKFVMRYPRSKLHLPTFEPEQYQAVIEKQATGGVELITLRQMAKRYDTYQRMIYDAEVEIAKDIPTPEPFKMDPFEEYRTQLFEAPDLLEDAFIIALDQDNVVGMSVLWDSPNPEKWYTGLTGIKRTHRRRGLATALKAVALGHAKSQGVVEVETDNEENNPMYQINLQLGFKPAAAYLDYMRSFEDNED